jgi:TolB-like protein/class 3 adenylate cyclase/tetratricopeptide (TPR) repeat protein
MADPHQPAPEQAPGAIEMANVLFVDMVGYSLLPMDQQRAYLEQLQKIVRESPRFRAAEAAGAIVSLPTGDGMALAFFGDPTAPVQCAVEVATALRSKPYLKLRMGIHSGPVYRVADVNANANVAGGGINMAQRVMDCGDAGHILVSKSMADVLLQLSQWSPYLTGLGECTVKHGVTVHVWNLASDELGNRERPRKFAPATPKKSKMPLAATLTLAAVAIVAGVFWIARDGKRPWFNQDPPSIAVLPFVNLSSEKDQDYFSDGLAEELLDALAQIPGLRVAARTSSFQFRDKIEDARVIGKNLNVAAILEGSVRRQGNRTKIATQLIKTADGFQLWSDTFDREMTDIFAVQEEIARAVTGKLKVKLMGQKTATPKGTNPDAYNAFLQGRYFLERRSGENLAKASEYFEQATKLDESYARAWVGLAEARNGQAGNGYVDSSEGYRLARVAAQRALTLDDNLGEAHAAMAWIQQFADRDWAGADASYTRARALDPGNAVIMSHAAILAGILGHLDEAIALDHQALRRDPLRPGGYHNAGVNFYYAGRDDEAAAAFKKVLQLNPGAEIAHCLLGQVYLAQSRPQEALAEMEMEKHSAFRIFGLTLAYHSLGRKKESDASLANFMNQFPGADLQIAEMYAFRGETDRAFEYLERANSERMKGDPLLKGIEHDPRYAALLLKMSLPL